jgi:transcriptional regulator with XRE-family HTH domain
MQMVNLRPLRDAKGWSREKLARRAGISAKTIEAHEMGIAKDVFKSVSQSLATALEVPEESLFFDNNYAPIDNLDPETLANLATAQAEHRLLTDMALETVRLEIAPETTTALERLAELVRVQGKRNQYGHKQYKNIILNGGLLELTDDEPEAVSEARAAQILEAL